MVNPTSRSKSWRHQSESTSSESTNKKVREDKKLYRRSTALLIHDDTFRNFDGRRFNNQFNVHTFKATGFKDLRNRSKKLQATIKRLRPDCIYVHIGSSDFMKKKSGIVGDVKELAEFLLDSTQAQICFSALVPSANNNQLNDKIELVNNDVRNYISWLHTEKPLTKNRIFTFSNNNVRGQNKHVVGSDVSFQLTERGQKMITRDTIKFLSWNINHSRDKIEGAKVDIPEIHKLFNSHDIFALQETKGVINISNYLCFNSNRKNSNSGGVCIGVHKSLTNGVINVPVTSSDDIIAIKLKACFFDLDRDTYLINVYDSPKNGAFKKRQRTTLGEDEVTTLEHLQEFLANIPINEDAILLGDFNARTATLEDMLSDNVRLNDEQLNEYFVRELPKRSNSDTKLNSNGRPFTELLQTSGLVFLNGRTLGDIFGEPTCIQRQGASTVDYICVSASLYHRVRHFRVNGISQYSDHRSLSMSISTNPLRRLSDDIALAGISDAPQAFKWVKSDNLTQDTATKFQMAQEAQLHIDRVNCLLVRPINSPSEVVQFNTDVVTLYQDLAGSVTVRKSGRRHNNKKKWFDINCRIAKRQANRADRNANNNPYSTFLREQHFLKKKEYRTTKRRKKHAFLHEMNNKINGADTINWSALKQLSANYKDEEPFDIYDLLLFQKFFSDLYNRQCCKDHPSIIDNDVRSQHSREHDLLHALNEDFTLEELTVTIKKLQNKKSVAEDLICNEMLKNSNKHLLELLQKLFNACLNHALDAKSLQLLLDRLNEYAETWELSVNISKTNVMVFNSSSRLLQCAHGFKLGNLDIEPVRNYCYLGIQFSLNGSFKQATEELRKKALRSYFSIRRIIDTSALTTSTLLKLIDSLVKPVATYGCPVWLPSTSLIKTIVTNTPDSRKTLPKAGAKDPLEVTHLRMLKWILGVHRRTNNNFCYGDTGRTPLAISVLPQCISYFLRASQAVDGDVNSLLHHTFIKSK
ncbi:hypothetical protein ACHWQZ_G001950 [Mnemiopsis leidyi]